VEGKPSISPSRAAGTPPNDDSPVFAEHVIYLDPQVGERGKEPLEEVGDRIAAPAGSDGDEVVDAVGRPDLRRGG